MNKALIIITFLASPIFVGAQPLPDFPMVFHGNAKINGSAVPAGATIRAYYGNLEAGKVVTSEAGVYGYSDPTKQQLLVVSGTGTIRFTLQSATINGGAETEGTTPQTHPAFDSGSSIHKNLDFTIATPPPPSNGGGSGGGGGGGAFFPVQGCMDKKAQNFNPFATSDNKLCIYPPGLGVGSGQAKGITVTPPAGRVLGVSTYEFTRNLAIGSKGQDVTELQKRLNELGYYSGPITGFFGPLTAEAVKKFQVANGLEAVGNVGPKTRAALNKGVPEVLGATTETLPAKMTEEQRQALIKQIIAMIVELQKKLLEMLAKGN
jgi:hypothetical protein